MPGKRRVVKRRPRRRGGSRILTEEELMNEALNSVKYSNQPVRIQPIAPRKYHPPPNIPGVISPSNNVRGALRHGVVHESESKAYGGLTGLLKHMWTSTPRLGVNESPSIAWLTRGIADGTAQWIKNHQENKTLSRYLDRKNHSKLASVARFFGFGKKKPTKRKTVNVTPRRNAKSPLRRAVTRRKPALRRKTKRRTLTQRVSASRRRRTTSGTQTGGRVTSQIMPLQYMLF